MRREKNRIAAQKSRMRQTQKADSLHLVRKLITLPQTSHSTAEKNELQVLQVIFIFFLSQKNALPEGYLTTPPVKERCSWPLFTTFPFIPRSLCKTLLLRVWVCTIFTKMLPDHVVMCHSFCQAAHLGASLCVCRRLRNKLTRVGNQKSSAKDCSTESKAGVCV